ncbi:MAG: Hsp70 family protein [Desulfobulbaceae bacterium]|nr:Hsp70 family protein [Desulfobulbaceae bacterium]
MSEVIVGIDLGTTNSEVAVWQNGKLTIISENDSKLIPSFVGLDNNNALLVGEPAKNQYMVYPERTIKSVKRKMGEDDKLSLGENSYSPQEISAIILKKLKKMAENHLNCEVHKAVITVPAYFSDIQRQATREAGDIAGLEVVKMINEPTAAALTYESGHQDSRRILVYDLGGGTFDVSVVQVEDDIIEVVAGHGNNHLGGDDFDHKITQHIITHLHEEHGISEAELSPGALARIERAAEAAKQTLSDNPFAEISEEYLAERDGVPINLSLELSRMEYEEMITPFIDETLEAVHIALKGAKLTASDIEEIVLVGGSTRTPLVKNRLTEEFGFHPRGEINPDLCVASGAAMQAAMIGGEKVSAVLVDITPYTFGTSAFSELDGMPYPHVFVPLIEKNTPIPVAKSEVFGTMYDDQEAVEVTVYQGENIDALQNISIGKFRVEGLSKGPANNKIIITCELDKDGILHVTAKEKNSGLQRNISINNAISRFEENELDHAKNKIASLFNEGREDIEEENTATPKSSTERKMHVQAKALVEKAERLFDDVDPDDREEMVNLIEEINDAMAANNSDAMAEAVEGLSEIIYYLES